MTTKVERLATDVSMRYFQRETGMGTDHYNIYTDWAVKLQQADRPVNDWIRASLTHAKDLTIYYLRPDTQELIPHIQWPAWSSSDLANIHEVHIYRFAITQLPTWLFTHMRLGYLIIDGRLPLKVNPEYRQILEFYRGNVPPLFIPKEVKDIDWVEIRDTETFPYAFDSEIRSNNQTRRLVIDITGLRSPVDDLGYFQNVEELISISHRPLSSYSFLSRLTKIKRLELHAMANHLPEEIKSLYKLEELNISQNSIKELPNWFNSLPNLRFLHIENQPWRDKQGMIQEHLGQITEYPSVLRSCPSLIYCSIGSVVRSLYNLPPIARYWAGLVFALSNPSEVSFDLPLIIREKYREQYPNRISTFNYSIDAFKVWIDEHRFGINDDPNRNPHLLAFLDTIYAESYEILFNRVRAGEQLTELEQERFIHETTYQYYQLLFNTPYLQVNSEILELLGQKFSVKINQDTQILL